LPSAKGLFDGENCQFFVWVDEAEGLGYFKNNGVGHGRNARLMEKPKSELRLIKILIGVICLIELYKMLLYCGKFV